MKRFAVWLVIASGLGAAACSSSGPPSDLSPIDLFGWSQEQFDAEEYGKAQEGFLAYLLRDPLSPLVDSAQYLTAEAQLRAGDALGAVEEFGRLATGRPNSPLADDAQLGACRAYLAASPKVSLSQEFTRRAIDECGRLIQFFPTTTLRAEAEALMQDARSKLAMKSWDIGRYYEDNRKLPESAIVYYEKALSEGPSEDFLPDLLSRLYHSYRTVGFDTEAGSIRQRLLTEFPDSPEARDMAEEEDPLGDAPSPG